MVASTMSPRSVTVATPSVGLSRALDGRGTPPGRATEGWRGSIDAFVGSLLDLVIHSVEELRERITRPSPR